MLLPTQWATRVGVDPSLASSGGADGVQGIKTLTLWRFMPRDARSRWEDAVTGKLHGSGTLTGLPGDFWRAVYQKKVGLFGSGTYGDVDPVQAYRHPWCMKKGEFVFALQAVELEMTPSSVPDDRVRITTLLSEGAFLVGAGATAMTALGIALTPGVGQVLAAVGAAGAAGALAEWEYDRVEAARLQTQLPALKSVYEAEARYRALGIS